MFRVILLVNNVYVEREKRIDACQIERERERDGERERWRVKLCFMCSVNKKRVSVMRFELL